MEVAQLTDNRKALRKFGLSMAWLFPLFFGGLVPWIFGMAFPAWPWFVSAFFLVFGLGWPLGLKYVHFGWMWIAEKLGRFNTRVILSLFFYVVVSPFGMVMRLGGWDPMRRRLSSSEKTYKVKRDQKLNMETPF